MSLSLTQGSFLVKSARAAIASRLNGDKAPDFPNEPWLLEKFGLFVTLHTFPEKELRGCIGFIEPRFALKDGIVRAALSAAFGDPRFPPLESPELEKIVIESSVLSKPEKINAKTREKILGEIKQKIDGLILEKGGSSGLFLPQVWDELPSKEEFLENLCYKAGLSDPEAWHRAGTELYRFRVQAFEEKAPDGAVIERKSPPK